MIGPSGCGKSTFIRCFNRMNDLIPGAEVKGELLYHGTRSLRAKGGPGRGAQAHRHGLPEAEPVPEVDLRQRRLRAARPRPEGQPRRTCGACAPAGRALGRGQAPAQGERAEPLGRPAAAPLHRPLSRRRARRHPHGRAGVRARPHRDDADRGPHAGPQAELRDRDRHAQHAAGGARGRHDGVLLRRRRGRGRADGHPRRVRPHRQDLHAAVRPAHRGLRHRDDSDDLAASGVVPGGAATLSRRRCRRRPSSSSARSAAR